MITVKNNHNIIICFSKKVLKVLDLPQFEVEVAAKPPIMSKSTLDYRNMCQSAFIYTLESYALGGEGAHPVYRLLLTSKL